MNRNGLLADIRVLEKYPSDQLVAAIAGKYQISTDKADELIDGLLQYISYPDAGRPGNGQLPTGVLRINAVLQDDFDLKRYLGHWYNAASIPQPFDRNTPWETADYRVLDPSTVEVLNTAWNKDETMRGKIVGTAELTDLPGALYVSFPTGQPRPPNPVANYLVHKTDYVRYAIVGSYDGSNLYILSRVRPMSRALYDNILEYVKVLGYDVNLLKEGYRAIKGDSDDDCTIL